jgi:hypothetical protein
MVTSLYGRYIYADFGSGRVWAIDYDGVNPAVNTQLVDAPFLVSSFGLDENGELYVLQYAAGGGIHRLFQMAASPGVYTYSLARVFDFYAPAHAVDLQHPGDASGRLFVVEQAGVIRVLTPGNSSGN